MGRPTTPIAPECVVEHNDNKNNSFSKTETQVVQASSKNQMDEILEGVDGITPLALTSTGASEASRFGYSSKLVSKWYRHQCQYQSCPERWAEHDNVDAEEAHLTQATQHVPIIHRHEFVNKHWVTNSITVQDASMRAVLDTVLAKYQDLDLEVENYTFAPPMMALVHRWEDLKAYYACATHVPLKNAASALIAFLAPLVASSVASQAQTKRTDKVSFPDLWQIFPPSSISKTTIYGAETVCRVIKYQKKPQTNSSPEGWAIHLEYVDWNGQETGWAATVVTIWDYDGHRRVTSLPVSPLSFARDEETIRAQMIERGRKFERLRGYHYMMSNGAKILLETAKPEQRPIAGKVCVDAYAYHRSCNIVRPKLRALSGSGEDEGKENGDTATKDGAQMEDGEFEAQYALPVDDSLAAKGPAERTETLVPLTEEQVLMTTPWVKGFDLKAKHWCELRIDDLRDMTWNDEAFEKLVLPGGEKELAWAFVENKSLSNSGADSFDDFIPDKGRGLIILMFGPPGVGKTFTAEAVAERSRVPLYSMGAADLGTHPAEVEAGLTRALELCRMWNAMCLFDEADVFLGERTAESIARNEHVSIFLTKLEYYQGILFLTTNRIASIDHAFQSRVDLFLPYHDLGPAARRQVWENFIERAGRDRFDMADGDGTLDRLAQLPLNGREIKNLIKSAQLLSLKSGGKVPSDRLWLLAEKRTQALKALDASVAKR